MRCLSGNDSQRSGIAGKNREIMDGAQPGSYSAGAYQLSGLPGRWCENAVLCKSLQNSAVRTEKRRGNLRRLQRLGTVPNRWDNNTGSRRALEKAGFAFEGLMKNNAVKNGKVLDMALYSLARTMEPYPVRRLTYEDIPQALELCWRVFLEFEAPEYSPEGIAAFRASLDNPQRNRQMDFYGAFDGETLVGVLSMRAPQHIGGFFVDAAYHRRGIGKKLFAAMRRDYAHQVFTVNSSPYAVEVYRHLGFVPTDDGQSVGGLRFTPMHYSPKQEKTDRNNESGERNI